MIRAGLFAGHVPTIVLITKTKTQNQGNQALSVAWRDFLSKRYPDCSIRLVERAPCYLKRYTLSSLARSNDPVAAFDALARKLVSQMPRSVSRDPSCRDVQHDHRQQQVIRFGALRQALNLRGRLGQMGLGKGAYLQRLAFICTARLVVFSPAGEFYPAATDTALHYLLETRCAQLAGARTAFVNLSFEVADPTLAMLSDHVFRQCDLAEFRDSESLAHLRGNGGTAAPIILPDGAAMHAFARSTTAGGAGLALSINALQVRANGLSDKWDDLMARLVERGPVTLTSNEWTTDYPFWQRYLELDGVRCEGQTLPYRDYARFLASFDIVVSSRLHTCVLGLAAGAPIIPVETGTFKLSGFFNMIGMHRDPLRMEGPNWQDALLGRIEAVKQGREERIALQDRAMGAARERLEGELGQAFRDEWVQA